ncbi:MAG: hypothetical protein ACI33K_11150 [Clostridiaceae bacterium]
MIIILSEIRKIIHRKQFWIVFSLLLITVFLDFFITCNFYYGAPLSQVPSAYGSFIIKNYKGASMDFLFGSFLFFLVAPIIASDIFYDEKEDGIHNYIFTRMSKERYVIYKATAMMLMVFFVIVFTLLTSQFLALSAFPIQGHLTEKITYNNLMEPDKKRVLSYFENFYPYLNNFIFIILRGITGAVAALLSFSITFVNHAKKYTILLVPMVFFVFYHTATSLIGTKISNLSTRFIVETYILKVNPYGSIWVIVGFLLFLFIISALFIWRGLRHNEALL